MRENVIRVIWVIVVAAMFGCSRSPKQTAIAVPLPPNPTAVEVEFFQTVTNAFATKNADTLANLDYWDSQEHAAIFAEYQKKYYLNLFNDSFTNFKLERVDPDAPGITVYQDGNDHIVESLPVRWIFTGTGHLEKWNCTETLAMKAGLYDGKIRMTLPRVVHPEANSGDKPK